MSQTPNKRTAAKKPTASTVRKRTAKAMEDKSLSAEERLVCSLGELRWR